MRDLSGRRPSGDTTSQSQTSDSSVGSAAVVSRRPATAGNGASVGPGAGAGGARTGSERRGPAGPLLSPRRTAELAARGNRGKGASREGSDGTPSMGSSFSDLDGESFSSWFLVSFFRAR
jgi:hypothetical protein